MEDFTCVSSRTAVYAVNDDYSGNYMTNPMVPEEYRNVTELPVRIEKHALVGSGCTILPGVTIGAGSAVGAMSLVKNDVKAGTMVAGIPASYIGERSQRMLELEKQFLILGSVQKGNGEEA